MILLQTIQSSKSRHKT